eukprot:2553542-Alexandrium_andersonii.AAC.1
MGMLALLLRKVLPDDPIANIMSLLGMRGYSSQDTFFTQMPLDTLLDLSPEACATWRQELQHLRAKHGVGESTGEASGSSGKRRRKTVAAQTRRLPDVMTFEALVAALPART